MPPETDKENSDEVEDRDILCGIGKFKPKWLQVFNNAKAMCIFITIYAFTHGRYKIFDHFFLVILRGHDTFARVTTVTKFYKIYAFPC